MGEIESSSFSRSCLSKVVILYSRGVGGGGNLMVHGWGNLLGGWGNLKVVPTTLALGLSECGSRVV